MKYLILSLFHLLIYCGAYAQITDDEKQVRLVIQKMEDAWNVHDYTYRGKYDIYDPKAVMINPVGMYWKNRTEILKGIQIFGDTRFRYETTKYNNVEVRFLVPTVALATIQSTETVTQDFNNPDGTKAH